MKYSTKLSLSIFSTSLFIILLLSFAIYISNYNSIITTQTKHIESIANEISEDIDLMLSEKIKTALTLANSNTIIQAIDIDNNSYSDLQDEIRINSIKQLNKKWKSKHPSDSFILEFTDTKVAQFLKKQQSLLKGEYGEIFLTNKFGALVASTSKLSTFAHDHKYWWQGSFNNGAVFFDDRGYDNSVNGYVLGLVVPVKKDDQVIGILKCNLNILGSINKLISGVQHKLLGQFKLIRSGGMVVYEEGFEPLSTRINDDIIGQIKINDQGAIIANASKEMYLVGFSQIKLTKGEKGYRFGGTFKSIDHKKGNTGESWYVLCYRRMSTIRKPIVESIKSLILTGITLLTALMLISFFFGKKIAQPLEVLNKATREIGRGNFEYTIEMSQNDEFSDLADSFNIMTNNLQKTTTSVEILKDEVIGRKKAETARAQLEAQIQQAQKIESIGTLAGGIAHDFNNILFPIIGHTEIMIDETPHDSPFRESLNEIHTASLRAIELVKQILTFSRQDSNELKLMKMQPVIREALKLIRSTIPSTIEIKQHIQSKCGVIKADPTQIHQIVMNLSTNAYHAMKDTGGVLNVSLKEIELKENELTSPDMISGIYACLIIADTGVGMNNNIKERIFNPFFTTKELGKGTGMGLSVVHGIVSNMNGAIHVYSEPDKGSEFHILVPVVKIIPEKQDQLSIEPIQGGTERILLVDDEKSIVSMEKLMLERLGYQVDSRTNSIEVLKVFRDNPQKFDLVISDMAMPDIPGDKLAAELNKIRSDIPVLLCTGFSETMSEEKAASLGINGFLQKPILKKDLSLKIRELLDSNL